MSPGDHPFYALLRRWGAAPAEAAPAGLFKFPRTHHVLDAGGTGVSRDDLLLDGADVARFVDGRTEVVRVRVTVTATATVRVG